MKRYAVSLAALVVPFAIASADQPRPRHPPPPQAIDACAKSKPGDVCGFAIHDHQVSGTCEQVPDSSTLVCRPDRPPPPPPQAITACEKQKQGDACSFAIGEHTLSGTCEMGPDSAKPLACRPPHP